jgi:hypothetical protein
MGARPDHLSPVRRELTGDEQMSTGGNVPTQGVDVQVATTEKKRNSAGKVGKGSAGGRLKSSWRSAKADSYNGSLREYIRGQAKLGVEDAKEWLSCKRPGGSASQRAERKAKGERVRSLAFSDSGKLTSPVKKKAG